MLAFIIPMRHPDNAVDWCSQKRNLSEVVRAISSQTGDDWKAVIVANHGSDLPDLPKKFEIKWVDFSPNPLRDRTAVDRDVFNNSTRLDKGRRVLAGLLHAAPVDYYMVVDDDDLVSKRLASFVSDNDGSNGWYVKTGYIWNDGRCLLARYSDFSKLCGTCNIVRTDLIGLPSSLQDASDDYIRRMLGSHIMIHDFMIKNGVPLAPLPFPGAVYRVNHIGSQSKSRGVLRLTVFRGRHLKNPLLLLKSIARLRLLNEYTRNEFFGKSTMEYGHKHEPPARTLR